MTAYEITIPATTANLGPGFDVLGMALGLYNRIIVHPAAELHIEIEGGGVDSLPTDTSNLVYQAMQHVSTVTNRPLDGVHIRLINAIPIASGLGSSSAALVGGMLAANALLGDPLSRADIAQLATAIEGHPDNVTPAVFGGMTASVLLEDGTLLTDEIALPPAMRVVVVTPRFQLLTSESRAALPARIPHGDAVYNIGRTALLPQAFATGNYVRLRHLMCDRLHQPYRAHLIPGFAAALQAAHALDAAAALSGAGPTLVAFTPDRHAEIADAVVAAFATAGATCDRWIVPIDARGARVTPYDGA